MTIQQQYLALKQQLQITNPMVQLLVVSKNATAEDMRIWYACGQRHFAENRLPHLQHMVEELKKDDITWHFVGHLQTNKVKKVLQYCDWVQSVDSIKLAQKINHVAAIEHKKNNILIQINIAAEPQKTGIAVGELFAFIEAVLPLKNINLRGLMCMAPKFSDSDNTLPVFAKCAELFAQVKQEFALGDMFDTLSMGMSRDYKQAIACGATQVRIGSLLL